jgi:integrase
MLSNATHTEVPMEVRKMSNVPDDVARYVAAARSPGTLRAYRSVFKAFRMWCTEFGKDHLNPDPVCVAEYLAFISKRLSFSTINMHLSAIVYSCRQAGHDVDFRNLLIRDTIQGIGRVKNRQQMRSAALMLSDIKLILGTCDYRTKGIRDRAMILIGFAGAFRRSEIVAIDVKSVSWIDDGVCIRIDKSKEDQDARGQNVIIINGQNPETCPVSALNAWLSFANITEGPVFRAITKTGRITDHRLSDKYVVRTVKERCEAAGITAPDGRGISSHGLRAGFITEAYRAGLSDEEIMGHTRHKGISVMRSYVRRERLEHVHPAGHVGL